MNRKMVAILIASIILISGGAAYHVVTDYLDYFSPDISVQYVCKLTGADAISNTVPYDVKGTDLGIPVQYQGNFHYIFGDTFGGTFISIDNMGANPTWRSNTIAVSYDTDFSNGISLNYWINDTTPGYARELIGSTKIDNIEVTSIPTGSITNGEDFYIFYMSIKHWGPPGEWICNNASVAYSSDGEHFTKQTTISWPGDGKCVQFAPIQDFTGPLSSDGYYYFVATPSGRFGNPYLVRCPRDELLSEGSYEFFNGTNLLHEPMWNLDMEEASAIFDATVGEASVMWNPYLERYIIMYFDASSNRIVVRTATLPWKVWSAAFTVVTNIQYPALYGGFMHPSLIESGGKLVYFVMSQWGPYNTYVLKADLTSLRD